MPKRRKKRRSNRDRQSTKLPRPSRAQRSALQPPPSAAGAPSGTNRQVANPADANGMPYRVGDVVSGIVTVFTGDGGLWLDVGGVVGGLPPWELPLAVGESAQDHYTVGDTIHDLFVWGVSSEDRRLTLSVRRNAPSYVEALNAYSVGDVVSATITDVLATITDVLDSGGLLLDVDGVVGYVASDELSLADGESTQDRYAVGDTVHDLFVWLVHHDNRHLTLSVRRNAPGYVEALNAHSVGGIVSATVTVLASDGGLLLDVDGVVGAVSPRELSLADGESSQDHYPIGDTVRDLFVWDVERDTRILVLSVRRNATSYVEMLNAHNVGEVVSATVSDFQSNGGLWLDVGGVVGSVPPGELSLAEGETAQDHYAVGDPVHDPFILQVNRGTRDLSLSIQRNTPGYVERLNAHNVGDIVSATVTGFPSNGGLWLDADGMIGGAGPDELPLADGESAEDRYVIGGTVHDLFVRQVDHNLRHLDLSVRRNAPGYVEALADISVGDPLDGIVTSVGDTLDGTLTEVYEGGLWLNVAGVIGWIPAGELELDDGEEPPERYTPGDSITARVWQIDQEAREVILSVHRLGTDSIEESIVLGATIDSVVREVHHGAIRVLVASQSIRILTCELSLSIGERPHFEYGQGIRVVVLALDSDGNPSALSHRRALLGWQAAVDRLAPGVIVPDAQIVPRSAVPESEDRAAIDLGPVNGFVRRDELDAKQAEELMTDAPNTQYPVVVESNEASGANVTVSRTRFEDSWRELAETISEGDLVDAEFRRTSGDRAIVDLGFGLLAEMPREQLPTINDAGEQRSAHEGDTFKVRITRKEDSAHPIKAEIQNQWLVDLIAGDESLTCEFKAVFKGPKPDEPSKNREVYSGLPVLRAMAGLMNRDGGHVLVGITDTAKDKGNVIGWEASGFKSQNELTTTLSNLVGSKLTPIAAVRYEPRFETLPDGREILDIDCEPADRPVFLKDSGSTEFLVRQTAETKPLDAEEQHDYIQERFYGAAADD